MQTRNVLNLEYLAKTNSFTLHEDTHYYDDDGEYIGSRRINSEGFVPGKINDVKRFLKDPNHPIASYVESFWTPDDIAKQQAKEAHAKAEMDAMDAQVDVIQPV